MPNQGQMNYGMGANMMAMNGSMNGYPMPAPGQVPRMMGMQVPMSPMQGMPGPYPVMQQPLGGSPQQASPQQTQQMASQMASQQAAAALQMQQIQMAHAVQAQAAAGVPDGQGSAASQTQYSPSGDAVCPTSQTVQESEAMSK